MGKIAKAITSAVIAGYAMFQAYSGDGITMNEWVSIGVTTLVAGLGVWLVPNTPSTPPSEPKA